MNYDHILTHLPIYKAALLDDWESVSQIFEQHPELMIKQITNESETPLALAVGTNRSHRFVRQLVDRIVAVYGADRLFVPNCFGHNPLHYAAKAGNTVDARILVELKPHMTLHGGGHTPLKMAAGHGNKDTLQYFLTVTDDIVDQESGTSPYTGTDGGDLIAYTIMAGFYDVALEIIDMHPDIVLEEDAKDQTALKVLAMKPDIFPSGSRLGFWGRFIYSLIPVKKIEGASKVNIFSRALKKFAAGFWSALQYLAPTIQNIHDIKVKHVQSNLLVKRICKIVIEKASHTEAWKILGSAITTAVEYGTYELIEECILTYPGIVWYNTGESYLFLGAIKQRQERVYNLVYQMSQHKVWAAIDFSHQRDDNTLHIAARLAPPHRLNIVTGAALQMQRELQWFKEIENFVEPSYKEALNKNKKTPRMVFTDEHIDLLKEGQQWMKDTSSSCTVVAALLVTIAYAAAFTVPGGNKDDGKPLFLNNGTFMLFIISDAIALFSSSASVLMFLGILTSRYAERDFLYTLPKRMTIGLLSLFLSLAATMIAFSATLALALQDKVAWIAAPLVILTGIPVGLFGLLQFPLLVELVYSTYGPSIFHQQSDRAIY